MILLLYDISKDKYVNKENKRPFVCGTTLILTHYKFVNTELQREATFWTRDDIGVTKKHNDCDIPFMQLFNAQNVNNE